MHSAIVVISWWSNCLALCCLDHLLPRCDDAQVYVIQVGKSTHLKEQFRQHAPPTVIELCYPAEAPADHSQVIEHTVRYALPDSEGILFLDHDVFLQANLTYWLGIADRWLHARNKLICVPQSVDRCSLTSPAFWVSPIRWPFSLSFDPVPFTPNPQARFPGLISPSPDLQLPVRDTLFAALDALEQQGSAGGYPLAQRDSIEGGLPAFPRHLHLGGLYLFANSSPPAAHEAWSRSVVDRFSRFFQSCHPDRIQSEDPVLLGRVSWFREVLNG